MADAQTVTVVHTVVSSYNSVSVSTVVSATTAIQTAVITTSADDPSQTQPSSTSSSGSNIGVIVGAVVGAIVPLVVVAILALCYFKVWRNRGERDTAVSVRHTDRETGMMSGLDYVAGAGAVTSTTAILPGTSLSSPPHSFRPGPSSNGGSIMGWGEASSSISGGGGVVAMGEKGTMAVTNPPIAYPAVLPAAARRRESDSGHSASWTNTSHPKHQPHSSVSSTDPLLPSSGPSSIAQTSYLDSTVAATDHHYNPYAAFGVPPEQGLAHGSPGSSNAAMYTDPRMFGQPGQASSSASGSDGGIRRNFSVSGRGLPSIPGAVASSPPPDRGPSISPIVRSPTLGLSTPHPFNPETRPTSPELPPPSYDETERMRLRESMMSQGGNPPQQF